MSKRIRMICSTTSVSHSSKCVMVLKTLNLQANKIAPIRKLLKITAKFNMGKASCKKICSNADETGIPYMHFCKET